MSESQDKRDASENDRRTLINLLAVIAILLLAAGGYWIVKQMDQSRKIEACLEARRPDCAKLAEPGN